MGSYAATWTRVSWLSRVRGRERSFCIACDRPARWRQTLTNATGGPEVTSYCDDHAFPEGMILPGL